MSLPLEDIVNIQVDLSPTAAARGSFNLALLIGTSTVISATDRVKIYTAATGLKDMLTDGFTTTSPEYIGAALVFSQNPAPTRVAIGVHDTSDTETIIEALTACRAANTEWYAVTYLGATPVDILAVAQFVESASPSCVQFYTSNDPLALTGDPSSIFGKLQAMSFKRSIGQYSITLYAVCGIMGYAMGANTGFSRSAYTLMHKGIVGIVPADIDPTQLGFLKAQNANYYISRGPGASYFMFEEGKMADGTWFDEVINLDMLVDSLQLSIIDLLKSRPKVPQIEAGMNDIKLSMIPSLENAATIGFIAPGQWNGPSIFTTPDYAPLQRGDMLEDGYLILSKPVDGQSQADRDARIAPPIYVPIKLAGAIHSVLVRITVNR